MGERWDRVASALLALGILTVVGIATLGPVVAPHDPTAVDFAVAMQGPSTRFPLGTDHFGRCTLSRLLHGGRATVGSALLITLACAALAVGSALAASLGPGLARAVSSRAVEVVAALPTMVVAIAIVGLTGPSLAAAAIGLAATKWTQPSRALSGLILTELRAGHVFAAQGVGASRTRIALHEVLPAVGGPGAILAASLFAQAVLNLSALSFLGLGAQPPAPEWGAMLSEARAYYFARPQLLVVPALAITSTVGLGYRIAHVLDARTSTQDPA
jgi:ABC-type dipeptide/oligopeptide/nickel transport system permease subunit